MPSCVFDKCTNHSRNKNKPDGITYHAFPKDELRKQKWLVVVRKQRRERDWTSTIHSRVCSRHFKSEDVYTTRKGLKRLSANAVPCFQTTSSGSVASSSSSMQLVLPNVTSDTESECEDLEATTSQNYDTTYNDPLLLTDVKEEARDPDDEQPMDQDKKPAVENYTFVESDIKKEPEDFEDTCGFEKSVTVLSHSPKITAQTEDLKRQLEAKSSLVEMYKNQVDELQQKNFVLQDQCEKLTKLLKKCLTKSQCKEIGTEFKEILAHPQGKVENFRKKIQQKESQYKAKIKMLLETIEESQKILQAKQKQWETKEIEFVEKIKQLEKNAQELQQGQVDNQAVRILENEITLEEKEREWLEKERQWLEHLEIKETQWIEKERLWQEQVEERDRQISELQKTRLESFDTNR